MGQASMILPSLSFIYLFLRGWLDASASEVQDIAYPFIYLFIYLSAPRRPHPISQRTFRARSIYSFIYLSPVMGSGPGIIDPTIPLIYLFIYSWLAGRFMHGNDRDSLAHLFIYLSFAPRRNNPSSQRRCAPAPFIYLFIPLAMGAITRPTTAGRQTTLI